jgi:hypothetical protein
MLINYTPGNSPAATIANQLKQGFGPLKHWEGSAGITSSAANADPTHFALGWADSINGAGSNQILIQYVRAGDVNLDGFVNLTDLSILATNYGKAGNWSKGDFDYNNNVGLSDLSSLATNYGKGLSLTPSQAQAMFEHDMTLFPELQAVPEPAAASLLVVACGLLLRRTTRDRNCP